ncbi:MAG: cold shock domain-containing protein, partial [Thiobacillus sp.]|nr:cold shock domain-containing protein [Thiobacillus sp.]
MTGAAPPSAPRSRGRLVSWSDERGFGFIAPEGGGPDVFVHASAFSREGRHIEVGLEYDFDLDIGKDGRPKAKRITS